jgi:hypothetical protein
MATEVYSVKTITLLNNISFDASPLKIKYLRSFMNKFVLMDNVKNDLEAIEVLSECTKIAMQQYMPHLSETIEDFIDLDILYEIIGQAAGIKINDKSEKTVKEVRVGLI